MRWMVVMGVLAALASAVSEEAAGAAMLCQKHSGVLFVRDPACKRKETQVTPESVPAHGAVTSSSWLPVVAAVAGLTVNDLASRFPGATSPTWTCTPPK